MAFLNILPKSNLSNKNTDFKELSKRYPPDKTCKNPLPIYIISSHGSIDFGINIQNTYYGPIINNNSISYSGSKGSNFFTPSKNTFIFHTSPLGSDATLCEKYDNMIVNMLLSGKKTRNTTMDEPPFVSFGRNLFSGTDVFKYNRIENIAQTYVNYFNEIINELCDDIYNNVKRYNFRRKNQKKRERFKKKYHMDRELNNIHNKTDRNYIKKKYRQAIRLAKYSEIDYKRRIHKCYKDIINHNIHYSKTKEQKPLIGIPNVPTIEKTLTFMDASSKKDESWYFGIIEVSNSTYNYLKENPDIKFTNNCENIKNSSCKQKCERILNNNHSDLLSGKCVHNNMTKSEWFTKRVNQTIYEPNTKHLSLSEITYQFGEGIYIVPNCSPLRIWNSHYTPKIIPRTMPHSVLFCRYNHSIDDNGLSIEQDKYINDENIDIINDEYPRVTEREIYRDIFKTLQLYNADLYTCFPTNISILDKSQRLPVLQQTIAPDCFVIV